MPGNNRKEVNGGGTKVEELDFRRGVISVRNGEGCPILTIFETVIERFLRGARATR